MKMFDKNFENRLDMGNICHYLLYGNEYIEREPEGKTMTEKYEKIFENFYIELENYREKVIHYNWSGLDEFEKVLISESMSGQVLYWFERGMSLNFEKGFITGTEFVFKLLKEIECNKVNVDKS